MTMRFGLQIWRFDWPGRPAETARLGDDRPGRRGGRLLVLSVMDHFVQIPQVGREWEDMLESTRRSATSPASTSTIRLGTLVTGITYRNLGARRQDRRHARRALRRAGVLRARRGVVRARARLYGWAFPPLAERYELLEDALELLPLMWGQGTPRFEGRRDHACRRRRATRARCRSASRSSSAGRVSGGRCASSPATPTPATCSASRRAPSPARSTCCASTATRRARPGDGHGHQPRRRPCWVASARRA